MVAKTKVPQHFEMDAPIDIQVTPQSYIEVSGTGNMKVIPFSTGDMEVTPPTTGDIEVTPRVDIEVTALVLTETFVHTY